MCSREERKLDKVQGKEGRREKGKNGYGKGNEGNVRRKLMKGTRWEEMDWREKGGVREGGVGEKRKTGREGRKWKEHRGRKCKEGW